MTCPAEKRHFAKSNVCVIFGDNYWFCFQQEPGKITFACWRTATATECVMIKSAYIVNIGPYQMMFFKGTSLAIKLQVMYRNTLK